MEHPRKLLLFVLLSLADLALTCWVLDRPGGQGYEANPVARWWLSRHGWAGLACFKALAVALVLGLAQLIARSRPASAGRVLGLGCSFSALVVAYSAALGWFAEAREAESEREYRKGLVKLNQDTRAEYSQLLTFQGLMASLCEGLVSGRLSLREAAARVAASEKGSDRAWRRVLATAHPGRTLEEMFAVCVLHYVITSLEEDPRADWQVVARLEREFRFAYGSVPPPIFCSLQRAPARG
jgi:hypothetical protein